MIRMSKLADYGIVLMTELAWRGEADENLSATELAGRTGLPAPVVSKILKALTKEGLLRSQRGANGGYALARLPERITVAQVIRAMEGPIAMTECLEPHGDCRQEAVCPVRRNWNKINLAVEAVLDSITLLDMLDPLPDHLVSLTEGSLEIGATSSIPPPRL